MQTVEVVSDSNRRPAFGSIWAKAKPWLIVVSLLGLGALNVLSLLNEAVHDVLFGGVRAVLAAVVEGQVLDRLLRDSPTVKKNIAVAKTTSALNLKHAVLEREHAAMKGKHAELTRTSAVRSALTRKISKRLATRVALGATRNASSVLAEAIPTLGVAVVLGVTALDLRDACETLKDLNELGVAFDHGEEDQSKVCGMKIPTKEEVLSKVRGNMDSVYRAAMDRLK